jgi:ribosome-associated translation inhibitor RaiA
MVTTNGDREVFVMTGTQAVEIQTHTRGTVSAGAVHLAVQRIHSLLRLAPGPVLFARVNLTMAADPAVSQPATAQVNLDLNGRVIRARAAGETMRVAIERMRARLRARLEHSARDWLQSRRDHRIPRGRDTAALTRAHRRRAPSRHALS